MLLTGLGLGGAGTAAYFVESDRIERRITASLDQELEEFNTLRETGIDPRTAEKFATVPRLAQVALKRNVPDASEVLIAQWEGRARLASNEVIARDLDDDPAFRSAVDPLVGGDGGVVVVDTVQGETNVAVQPISDDTRQGAWMVVLLEDRERADFREVMTTYAFVAALALFAVSIGAWSVAGRLLRPVRELRATAHEISESDLSQRIPVDGKDDISDLVRTVNAMLDRLEDAFAAQRTFVDDAGHELRTPVTILRGHLELVDAHDPEDVAATRLLLLDEIDRMSRLVDDLIVLAKAQRPDFVQPAMVDAGALTDQLLSKASGTAERSWQLDARVEGDVSVDAQRITQAVLQLVSNAVRHTGPDDVVAIGSDRTARAVRWWVRDTGSGIAADEQEHIFDRFRRGTAGPVSAESSGLGLSIVRAIAEGHGGRVELQSIEGHGATFVISVPAAAAPAQPRAQPTPVSSATRAS